MDVNLTRDALGVWPELFHQLAILSRMPKIFLLQSSNVTTLMELRKDSFQEALKIQDNLVRVQSTVTTRDTSERIQEAKVTTTREITMAITVLVTKDAA